MTLTERLGIALPIIQAPMAGAQDHRLAAAVSNAGALGSLPCALLSPAALRAELAALAAATDRPYNVNFFCHTPPRPDAAVEARWREALAPYYAEFGIATEVLAPGPARRPFDDDAAEQLARFPPRVVSFHFGLPDASLLARVKALGATILASATTVEEACWLEARGADVLIAQGLEAGGHRGHFLSDDLSRQSGLFALLPRMVRAVRIPVVASGGIADARGIAAALALGASGVQVGTAYLLCDEAATSPVHRQALRDPAVAAHTALTRLFSGRHARGIVNRLMREMESRQHLAPQFPLAAGALAPLRTHAEARRSGDFSPLWCGQNPQGCRELPAAALTRELAGVA